MRLRKFRVRAFRCIHDSGEIKVGDLAAFVGRNESGKTTILEGLTLLNRDKEVSELDLCDEMSEELKNEINIADGEFELRRVVQAVSIPVVAIGGITPERARAVAETGACGCAAIGAVMGSPEPGDAVRALLLPFGTAT